MERLWAPWRMEFILANSEGKLPPPSERPCVFCRLLEEEDGPENLVLHRGARCYVVMNKYPYTNGHLMVLPNRHVSEFGALEPEEGKEMMALSQRCVAVLEQEFSAQGFNLGLNLGRVAGAGITEHLHLHVVPRWAGDHNFMPVLGEVRVIPQHIRETYRALRKAFR